MKKIAILLAASIFALLFLLSFVPGLSPLLRSVFFWAGQAGLALSLMVLFAIGTSRKRPE